MTDSMKFGPGWLRNMSAEPSGSSSNNTTAATASGRNLFPEYRYGREEMLSLFDRNCLLPQILPSFKKLFVEKVQYPLALTPSSDEDNNQVSVGSSPRPAWLQRSSGGFSNASRGNGRGGTVDRGRMRGKSMYHPIYQRPSALYDDVPSAMSAKAERNWTDRNGTADSLAMSTTNSGLEWNGTPSSSPRKEFSSSQHRNMENWRRTRNEDGSGDGPSASLGSDITGWRSSGGGSCAFAVNSHRWGRSTSWRDEDVIMDSPSSLQRSISTVGTVGIDRERSGNNKASGSGCGAVVLGGMVNSSARISTKNPQIWTGNSNTSSTDVEENLPEWAMENPSELGGTFDASGAFHGDSDLKKNQNGKVSFKTKNTNPVYDITESKIEDHADKSNENDKHPIGALLKNEVNIRVPSESEGRLSPLDPITNSDATHGDISDRIKEVVDEVEKLIMDDDSQITQKQTQTQNDSDGFERTMPSLSEIELTMKSNSVEEAQDQSNQPQHSSMPILIANINSGSPHPSHQHPTIQFSDQGTLQHHHQQLSAVPPHMINSNPNEFWFYRDPQSNVQGPFSAVEMAEWYRAGYFNENLYVRRLSDNRFRPLGELIKLCHGNMPFTHSHLIPSPMELDNYSVGQISATNPAPLSLNSHKSPPPAFTLSVGEQQLAQQRDDQLKANVTAVADSLSAALKRDLIGNNIDTTSHMLAMRFQMMQEQYLQHQEYQILTELSKNECFQGLSSAEREAVVRRKVQMLILPEYLSSLNGLSNCLSVLNPIAGTQLNNAVVEQSKKDQHLYANTSEQPHAIANLLDANHFILNAQMLHQQVQQMPASSSPVDHVMQGGSLSDATKRDEPLRNDLDLLNEYNLRMLLRGQTAVETQQHSTLVNQGIESRNDSVNYMTKSQLLGPQNLMIPMWLPPVKELEDNQQWPGISDAKVPSWEVASLEQGQGQNQHALSQKQQDSYAGPIQTVPAISPMQSHMEVNLKQSPLLIEKNTDKIRNSLNQTVNKSLGSAEQLPKKEQHSQPPQQPVKHSNKLSATARQQQQPSVKQCNEEERKREVAEEKRRLKEERKRQQIEEERRRLLQEEEKKKQQTHEEKERQHQIQAQRRKAMLGNSQSAVQSGGTGNTQVNKNTTAKAGDLQTSARLGATSMAPWSIRSPNSSSAAPGLAEIQKAERRERRADQQRLQEQLDRQMRANAAAAAEANDALLKWQAAPTTAPVMSLADIQAEEAKRLTNELLEQQRRREQEQQQYSSLASSVTAGGICNIWGGSNKAWNATCAAPGQSLTSTGLWEEPSISLVNQTSALQSGSSSNITAAVILSTGLSPVNKHNLQAQNKPTTAVPSPRNLRKSQTLPAINNTGKTNKAVLGQSHMEKNKLGQIRTSPKVSGTILEDKDKDRKSNSKNQPQPNTTEQAASKVNEYVNEFTNWCIKSLDNMAAKVDVPTFVAFLQDLEAPYEVKDYVRMYLGEGKESSDFAKHFLERRSKYKSLQRAQNAHNDDMCKPAPAITPSANDNSDSKNKQKKIKKNKMTKMDARILGFSVTAAEGRINVGGRDYVEGP